MKMGEDGTAFWLEPTAPNAADVGQLESPVGSPHRSPTAADPQKVKDFALPKSNVNDVSPQKKSNEVTRQNTAAPAEAPSAQASEQPTSSTSPSALTSNPSPSSTLTATNTSTNKKVHVSSLPFMSTPSSSTQQHFHPHDPSMDSPSASKMGPSLRSDASFATCFDGNDNFSPTKAQGRLLQSTDRNKGTPVIAETSDVKISSFPDGSLPEGAERLADAEAEVDAAAGGKNNHIPDIDANEDSILSDEVDPADRATYSELIQSLEASKAVTPLMAANLPSAGSFPDLSASPEKGSMARHSGDDVTSPSSFAKPPLAPSPGHPPRQSYSANMTPPTAGLVPNHSRLGSVGDLVLSKFASIDNMAEDHPHHSSTTSPPQGHLSNNKAPTTRSRSGSDMVAHAMVHGTAAAAMSPSVTVAKTKERRSSGSPMEQLKDALSEGVPPPEQPNTISNTVGDNTPGAVAAVAAQVLAAGDAHTPTTPEIEGVTSAVYDSDLDEDSNEDVLDYGSEEDEEKVPLNGTLSSAEAAAQAAGALFQRTLTPIAADLKRLNLKEGANIIRYRTSSSLRGSTYIEGRIFLWGPNTKIVVSDVDGTITKSDVLGHILPLVGKDWTHTGICDLYTKCAQNGYQFLYVTARSVSYMAGTRRFLWGIVQDKKRLPLGPILTAPDRFFAALTTEVSKRSHEFKIACLEGVKKAFPPHAKPFYAGFGNRINDVVAYSATGIPKHKIFIIDHEGVVHVCKVQQSYLNLSHLVHETFPPLKGSCCVRQHPHSYATNNYPGAEASLPAAAIQGVLPGNAPSAKNCGGGNASLFGVPGADSNAHDSLGNSIDDPNADIKLEDAAKTTGRSGSPTKDGQHNSGSASPGVTAERPSSAGGNNTNRSTSSQLGSSFNDTALDIYEDPHQEEQDFNSFNFWRMDPKDYLGTPKVAPPTKKLSGIKENSSASPAQTTKQRPKSPLNDHILVAPSQAGKEGVNPSRWASTVGSTKEVTPAKPPVSAESNKGGLRSWIPWPRSSKPAADAAPSSKVHHAPSISTTSSGPMVTPTQSGAPSPTSIPSTPSKKEAK